MEGLVDKETPDALNTRTDLMARQEAAAAFKAYFTEHRRRLEDRLFTIFMWSLGALTVAVWFFKLDFVFGVAIIILAALVLFFTMVRYSRWKVTRDFHAKFPRVARWLPNPPEYPD